MPMAPDPPDNDAQAWQPDRVTWAVLLGRWTDFARSAVALPEDSAGRRLRDSVADLIGLQAVWFALSHLEALSPEERALGLLRAGVLIDRHEQALRRRFAPDALPEQAEELVADARAALAQASAPPG